MPGTVLNLQTTADGKPEVYAADNNTRTARVYQPAAPVANAEQAYVATSRKRTPPAAEMAEHEEETAAPLQETVAGRENKKSKHCRRNSGRRRDRHRTQATEKKAVDESKMTALEKLKAHMDKSVYADRKEHFAPQQSNDTEDALNGDNTEEVATLPARKAAKARPVAEPERNRKKEKETVAKGKDKAKEKPNAKGKSKARSHTVRKGETAFGIAERYDISVSQLQKWNKLSSAKKIQPGMKLKVQP